ncbi:MULTISPECIES: hypothetical protein [Frankia]|uniref:Uncharacterized protein n=1 Tax=Frankia alni (strain DSM 45986 / CECT 9034 / ACN14a) TaxID=326424 RepID=Q0REG9_FRAAA|nr:MULTISPECIES: hypothetical protein [Frankia]CAJ64141.1 hypothetical protein; putative ''Winged helix'' DNA-binding domain [Frankia alni ACN14a]
MTPASSPTPTSDPARPTTARRTGSASRDRSALSAREAAILLALLAQDRPISNEELRERFRFTLVGAERRRLNELRLVESGKVPGHGNFLFHQVTDAGWARGCQELAPRPIETGTLPAGVFFAVAEGLHRFLEREQIAIGELFRADPPGPADSPPASATPPALPDPSTEPAAGTATAPSTAATATVDAEPADEARPADSGRPADDMVDEDGGVAIEAAIRAAYASLAAGPYDWVRLAKVRPLLGGTAKAQVDRALRRMARQPDVRVVPDEDQKSLNAADRAAAVRIGEHDNHLLLIGPA